MTNSGTFNCGVCSASTPSDSLCSTSGPYTKGTAPSCPTACGLGSSTQTGTVSCGYDSCTGSSSPNTRSCSATAACALTCPAQTWSVSAGVFGLPDCTMTLPGVNTIGQQVSIFDSPYDSSCYISCSAKYKCTSGGWSAIYSPSVDITC
jgi:hypothetical protein